MQNDPSENIQSENSEEKTDAITGQLPSPTEGVKEGSRPEASQSPSEANEPGQEAGPEVPVTASGPAVTIEETGTESTQPLPPESATSEKARVVAAQKPLPDQNSESQGQDKAPDNSYYVRFRKGDPPFSGASRVSGLAKGEIVMAQTDHGLEPATITSPGPEMIDLPVKEGGRASYLLTRRANRDEISKFERLMEREKEAFELCQQHIAKHKLQMKLTRVERFFNGSKIIFYFTAENRVDFRELVKDLVQEFRTRVEIRQIGVRHETKMIGGLGCCGRELCCSSFIKNFSPVSIKMAKAQNLPLNPAKISGVCNRLLCCLTYEYETYRKLRKGMPKLGKLITLDGIEYKVINSNILGETITVMVPGQPDQTRVLSREEWLTSQPKHHEQQKSAKGRGPRPPQKQKPKHHKKGRPGKGYKTKHNKKDHKKE